MSDPTATGQGPACERRWTVLVVRNLVAKVYPGTVLAGQLEEMETAARRLAGSSRHVVRIYQVDSRLTDPPQVGAAIDPVALRWVEVRQVAPIQR